MGKNSYPTFLTSGIVLSSWKPSQNKRFLAPNFLGTEPSNFWHTFANLAHFPTCCKVWLCSAPWPPIAKAAKEAAHSIYGGWEKYDGPTFWHLWTKVHEILKFEVGDPGGFRPIANIAFFPKILVISLEVVKKTNKCIVFWPSIFSGMTAPTFLWQIVSAIYFLPFGKVWSSSICWPPYAKPGNEVECRIYRGWVKTPVLF